MTESVSAVGYVPVEETRFAPLDLPPIAPLCPFHTSTLQVSAAAPNETPAHRPVLPAPNGHYAPDLIQTIEEYDLFLREEFETYETDTLADERKITEIGKAKYEAICAHAREVAARETWNHYADLCGHVAYAAFFVFGASTGNVPLMVASGVGFGTQVFNQFGAWNYLASWFTSDHETQVQAGQVIHTAASIASLGVGAAATASAYAAGALVAAGQSLATQVSAATSLAATAISTLANLASAYAQRSALLVQAQLKTLVAERQRILDRMNDRAADEKNTLQIGEEITATFADLVG